MPFPTADCTTLATLALLGSAGSAWTGQRVASIAAQRSALDRTTTTLRDVFESLDRKRAGGTYRRR